MSRSPKPSVNDRRRNLAVALTVGLLAAVCPEFARAQDEWTRNFRIGGMAAFNISAKFTISGTQGLSTHVPGLPGVGGVDHYYDDGYVRVDGTGNAGGVTSFWGYSGASQYNPATQTLTYHSTQGFIVDSSTAASDAPYVGMDLAYGGRITDWGGFRIGWELGFGWLPITITDTQPLAGTVVRNVQQFNTGGILLPQAPYNGGSSGLGPVIPDVATALPNETTTGTVTGRRTLDVTLYNIRLGPTIYREIFNRWAVSAGAGVALGVVDGAYRYHETVNFADGTSASNVGQFGQTDLTYGGYANAMLYYHDRSNADVFLGVQFLTLGNSRFAGNGREADLRLGSALSVMAGFNWPF